MTEMVERVARAAGITPEQAVLAIKAMREPTDEMFDAAGFVHGADDVLPFWGAMIGAALGEEK